MASLQDRMFSSFIIIMLPPIIINSVVPKYYSNMALWMAREYPSRIYGWVAFATANIVSEIPAAIITSVIYFLLWYFPVGFPTDASSAGYVFLMTMVFFLFQAAWGQWICSFAPSFTVIANTLPFFFVMFGLFNGIVTPYSSINVFWKYWMYYLIPSTWWIRGVMSSTLPSYPVQCEGTELTTFDPPPGQTCGQYAGLFASMSPGYLLDNNATSDCQYCQYTTGRDFMHTLNVHDGDKWRCFGIFTSYMIVNYMLVYFFIYTVRVRGWSFGMGLVFGTLGKIAGGVMKGISSLFSPLFSKKEKKDVEY